MISFRNILSLQNSQCVRRHHHHLQMLRLLQWASSVWLENLWWMYLLFPKNRRAFGLFSLHQKMSQKLFYPRHVKIYFLITSQTNQVISQNASVTNVEVLCVHAHNGLDNYFSHWWNIIAYEYHNVFSSSMSIRSAKTAFVSEPIPNNCFNERISSRYIIISG